jgi:hypothetical protein
MSEREPDWTAETMNRKKGDTTFKQCGWCVHAGSGSYRYSCMLDGSCKLLKGYRNEVKFDTPCKVVGLGKGDIADIVRSKEYEIKTAKDNIKETKKEIDVLKSLKVKDSPPLAESRDHDHFNLGDRVFVFYEGRWNPGTVVNGYRHHDGCVSYVLDAYPESKPGKKGPWGCGMSVPGVIKEWEFSYFQAHRDEFKLWLAAQDRAYNGNRLPMKDYFDALPGARQGKREG